MTSTVEVLYRLYEQPDPAESRFVVAGDAYRALADALEWADPLREVEAHGNVADQNLLLREYVRGVPFDAVAHGYELAFEQARDSRWDEVTKSWVKTVLGGAITVPVPTAGIGGPARLHLAVWTRGATSNP